MRIILVTILTLFPLALHNNANGAISEISATVNEGQTLQLAAPKGFKIDRVVFASYGTPVNYTIGRCHAPNSLSIVGAAIKNESLSIPATNSIFGDPCGGTYKRLSVVLAIQELKPKEPLTLNDPSGLSIALNAENKTVTLNWTAPAQSNTSPERYAIMWRTANTNGWGIATGNVGDSNALNTSITIGIDVVSQAGLDKIYIFQVRADNDTLKVYSNHTSPVEILIPDFARIAAEKASLEAKTAEEARLKAEAEAKAKEEARLQAEAAALLAAQQEAARIAAEAEAKRIAAEKEAKRLADIAEQKRLAEIERQRLADLEAARIEAEIQAAIRAEQDRLAAIAAAKAEADRLAAIEAARKAEEERLAAEAAAKAAEEERIAAELAKAKAEEEARLAEEARLKAEAEAKAAEEARLKAEAEAKAAEEKARLEAEKIAEEKAKAEAEAKSKAEEKTRLEAEKLAAEKAEEERLAKIAEEAKAGKELSKEEVAAVVTSLVADLKPGESISAAQVQESGVSYSDLPPSTPVEVRTDENGNALVITAEVAANIELVQDPGALLEAAFSDPGAALQALGSIGADMTEEEREEATEMVVATVVAAGAAINAAAVATGGATGGSTGGGGSSGGGSGANSPGSRGGRKW